MKKNFVDSLMESIRSKNNGYSPAQKWLLEKGLVEYDDVSKKFKATTLDINNEIPNEYSSRTKKWGVGAVVGTTVATLFTGGAGGLVTAAVTGYKVATNARKSQLEKSIGNNETIKEMNDVLENNITKELPKLPNFVKENKWLKKSGIISQINNEWTLNSTKLDKKADNLRSSRKKWLLWGTAATIGATVLTGGLGVVVGAAVAYKVVESSTLIRKLNKIEQNPTLFENTLNGKFGANNPRVDSRETQRPANSPQVLVEPTHEVRKNKYKENNNLENMLIQLGNQFNDLNKQVGELKSEKSEKDKVIWDLNKNMKHLNKTFRKYRTEKVGEKLNEKLPINSGNKTVAKLKID